MQTVMQPALGDDGKLMIPGGVSRELAIRRMSFLLTRLVRLRCPEQAFQYSLACGIVSFRKVVDETPACEPSGG